MKQLILSDHTGNQLQASKARRDAQNAALLQQYQTARAQQASRQQATRNAISDAWQARRPWDLITALSCWVGLLLKSGPKAPLLQTESNEESIWSSGREGEQAVARRLGASLGEEWTLISGYRNRRGEIDAILVGPGGVFAIEVKTINGRIFCDGDRWWRDKYDRYGNLVEEAVPITDRGGRGPSQQVNESADILQAFLAQRAGLQRIRRVVIFAHEASQIGSLNRQTVDCVATLRWPDLLSFFIAEGTVLDGAKVMLITQTIQKDHQFHHPVQPANRVNVTTPAPATTPVRPMAKDLSPRAATVSPPHADGRVEPTLRL